MQSKLTLIILITPLCVNAIYKLYSNDIHIHILYMIYIYIVSDLVDD